MQTFFVVVNNQAVNNNTTQGWYWGNIALGYLCFDLIKMIDSFLSLFYFDVTIMYKEITKNHYFWIKC